MLETRKFQAPNNKSQRISNFQFRKIQTQTRLGFNELFFEIYLEFEYCHLGFSDVIFENEDL